MGSCSCLALADLSFFKNESLKTLPEVQRGRISDESQGIH